MKEFSMTKALEGDKIELVKALGLYGKVDFALPQDWANGAHDLGVNIRYFVWDYSQNTTFGKPLNILEAFVEKYSTDISEAVYLSKKDQKCVQ